MRLGLLRTLVRSCAPPARRLTAACAKIGAPARRMLIGHARTSALIAGAHAHQLRMAHASAALAKGCCRREKIDKRCMRKKKRPCAKKKKKKEKRCKKIRIKLCRHHGKFKCPPRCPPWKVRRKHCKGRCLDEHERTVILPGAFVPKKDGRGCCVGKQKKACLAKCPTAPPCGGKQKPYRRE